MRKRICKLWPRRIARRKLQQRHQRRGSFRALQIARWNLSQMPGGICTKLNFGRPNGHPSFMGHGKLRVMRLGDTSIWSFSLEFRASVEGFWKHDPEIPRVQIWSVTWSCIGFHILPILPFKHTSTRRLGISWHDRIALWHHSLLTLVGWTNDSKVTARTWFL